MNKKHNAIKICTYFLYKYTKREMHYKTAAERIFNDYCRLYTSQFHAFFLCDLLLSFACFSTAWKLNSISCSVNESWDLRACLQAVYKQVSRKDFFSFFPVNVKSHTNSSQNIFLRSRRDFAFNEFPPMKDNWDVCKKKLYLIDWFKLQVKD